MGIRPTSMDKRTGIKVPNLASMDPSIGVEVSKSTSMDSSLGAEDPVMHAKVLGLASMDMSSASMDPSIGRGLLLSKIDANGSEIYLK